MGRARIGHLQVLVVGDGKNVIMAAGQGRSQQDKRAQVRTGEVS